MGFTSCFMMNLIDKSLENNLKVRPSFLAVFRYNVKNEDPPVVLNLKGKLVRFTNASFLYL